MEVMQRETGEIGQCGGVEVAIEIAVDCIQNPQDPVCP